MAASSENIPKPNNATVIFYRECVMKNHQKKCPQNSSSPIGGRCDEFKPDLGSSGDPLVCLTCGCHQLFHRKIIISPGCSAVNVSDLPPPPPPMHPTPPKIQSVSGKKYREVTCTANAERPTTSLLPRTAVLFGNNVVSRKRGRRAATEKSNNEKKEEVLETQNDDDNVIEQEVDVSSINNNPSGDPTTETERATGDRVKKPRTRFTKVQKERATEFMNKRGWKISRSRIAQQEVQNFCDEIEIRRNAFRYWVDNTKRRKLRRGII